VRPPGAPTTQDVFRLRAWLGADWSVVERRARLVRDLLERLLNAVDAKLAKSDRFDERTVHASDRV